MVYNRINISLKFIKESCKSILYKTDANKFTRERKMNQSDFVWYMTMQKGRTISMELDEYLKEKNGNYEIDITKQAFSKQRQFLKPAIFIDLYSEYLKSFYQKSPEEVKTYKGYTVLAVDGTMFEIPNTEELRELYKAQVNSSKDRISARARVSGIYDVLNGFMVNALIKDCGISEIVMAYENIENSKQIIDLKKSIIIFDRGYPSVELLLYLEDLGIKYICRLQSLMYDEEKRNMTSNDEFLEIKINNNRRRKIRNEKLLNKAKEQKSIKARITKVLLNTGEIEFLVSNIDKETISEPDMKDMYFKRWQVEIGYDILKNKLHLENFTGKTKITIEQDFYAQIYTYNLLQDIKNEANKIIIEEKAKKNLIDIKPDRNNERKEYNGMNKYRTNLRPNM